MATDRLPVVLCYPLAVGRWYLTSRRRRLGSNRQVLAGNQPTAFLGQSQETGLQERRAERSLWSGVGRSGGRPSHRHVKEGDLARGFGRG